MIRKQLGKFCLVWRGQALRSSFCVRRAPSGFGELSVIKCIDLATRTAGSFWHETCLTHRGIGATEAQPEGADSVFD